MQKFSVDGGWSAWSNWTVCNHTCGSGVSFRTRSCSNPEPKYGGYPCYGEKEESATCPEDKNIPECKNTCVLNCCQGTQYAKEVNRICTYWNFLETKYIPILLILLIVDYQIYPGSNNLWHKNEFHDSDVPNCCFKPMWITDSNGTDVATCMLIGGYKENEFFLKT